jgi:hypothetical protein
MSSRSDSAGGQGPNSGRREPRSLAEFVKSIRLPRKPNAERQPDSRWHETAEAQLRPNAEASTRRRT